MTGSTSSSATWISDPEEVKKRLMERQEELLQIAQVSAESRKPVELDQTRVGRLSRMDALQGQAMSLETERRRQSELQRIDLALGRLKTGDFGFCLSCGEEIAPRRLALDLTVATCIDCASG
ncbi:MAG: TraR/DksA family transcriptional regulator [Pseudomonadota bacterium]